MRLQLVEKIVCEEPTLQIGEVGPAVTEPLVVAMTGAIWIEQEESQYTVGVFELQITR